MSSVLLLRAWRGRTEPSLARGRRPARRPMARVEGARRRLDGRSGPMVVAAVVRRGTWGPPEDGATTAAALGHLPTAMGAPTLLHLRPGNRHRPAETDRPGHEPRPADPALARTLELRRSAPAG